MESRSSPVPIPGGAAGPLAKLVDILGDDAVLIGTPSELADRLGVELTDLLTALRPLLDARQIVLRAHEGGRLSVRRERRLHERRQRDVPVALDRRRAAR